MTYIPTSVLTALNTGSGILPAVGLSILMTIIMKKGMWAFLIFGFVLNAYLGLNTLAVTFISMAFATIYMWIMQNNEALHNAHVPDDAEKHSDKTEEETYDL
jgi:PTS system mannose-specific IIC component